MAPVPQEFSSIPFGQSIDADEVADSLAFLDDWEDRYRYIIDLGKRLPQMPAAKRIADNTIHGCQSQVWIDHYYDAEGNCVYFEVDSDALIVRGLAAVVLSALNARAPSDVESFDVEQYFQRMQLLSHLSPTRGNGLRSMVRRIKACAHQHLD